MAFRLRVRASESRPEPGAQCAGEPALWWCRLATRQALNPADVCRTFSPWELISPLAALELLGVFGQRTGVRVAW